MYARAICSLIVTALVFNAAIVNSAHADWSADPAARTTVCDAGYQQYAPRLVKVKGGVILTWQDRRRENTHVDLYGQKLTVSGNAVWPENGRVIAAGPAGDLAHTQQQSAGLVQDGLGGVLAAWNDNNGAGYSQAFATRVSADATVAWGDPGVLIQPPDTAAPLVMNPALGQNHLPKTWGIAPDSEGGFFAPVQSGIARYDHAGVRRTDWFEDPTAQRDTGHTIPMVPVLDSEGRDGIITVWPQGNLYFTQDVRARMLLDPESAWPESPDTLIDAWGQVTVFDPTPLSTIQVCRITAVPDGDGGAIAVWIDNRVQDQTGKYFRVYAQKIDALGNMVWPGGGVEISGDLYKNACFWWSKLYAVEDGAGGVVIAWNDGGNDQRAQRLNSDGVAMWEGGGVVVAHSDVGITTHGLQPGNKVHPPTGDGSFIVLYHHGTDEQLVTQNLGAALGEPAWGAGEIVYDGCFSPYNDDAVMVSDGYAGAIIAWPACNGDLYAHRVLGNDVITFKDGFE